MTTFVDTKCHEWRGHSADTRKLLIMAERLSDGLIKKLPTPATGNKLHYDAEVKGFACRVTAAGQRSFVLNYRAAGRERRYTIGSFPDWSTTAAREEAKALKKRVDRGEDPMV